MRLVDADKIKNYLEWDKLDGYQERDDMEDWELIDVKYSQGFNAGIDRAIYYLGHNNVQQPKGVWKKDPNAAYWYNCSECGNSIYWELLSVFPKYCSNCGSKMDGD